MLLSGLIFRTQIFLCSPLRPSGIKAVGGCLSQQVRLWRPTRARIGAFSKRSNPGQRGVVAGRLCLRDWLRQLVEVYQVEGYLDC